MHTASKDRNERAPVTSIQYCLKSEVSIILRCQYVQPIIQHYESRTVQKAPLQSK